MLKGQEFVHGRQSTQEKKNEAEKVTRKLENGESEISPESREKMWNGRPEFQSVKVRI